MNYLKTKQIFDQFSVEPDIFLEILDDSKFVFNREYDLNTFCFKGISCNEPIQLLYHILNKPRHYNNTFNNTVYLLHRIILQTSDVTIKKVSEINFLLDRYSMNQSGFHDFLTTFLHLHIKSPRLSKYIMTKMNFFKVTPSFYKYLENQFRELNACISYDDPEQMACIKFFRNYVNDQHFPIKKILNSDVQQLFFALHDRLTVRYIIDHRKTREEEELIYHNDLEYLVDVYDVDSLKILLVRYNFTDVTNKSLNTKIKSIIDFNFLKNIKDEKYENLKKKKKQTK
ncbi:expressed protein [Dictyostelium purpureum]|uniref:Expressed protein n=1 Tax=Dictyostelium purpureum TaxID=5786 RepID=F0ZLB8_DICPU|nr:uncharacterized protein DICPUDRAFT_92057 [Dictyostelium purpureum]EGC35286.1 expressed protein [Dictyostelium purpureum]|eukprot:XP_003288212.1 expressed protein [Dictyostelium purpureum]